jgi:hypothetical protein
MLALALLQKLQSVAFAPIILLDIYRSSRWKGLGRFGLGAAGGVGVAAGAGAIGLTCAGIEYGCIVAIHGAHHFFPEFGRRLPHIQVIIWKVGEKGSHWIRRIPMPWY